MRILIAAVLAMSLAVGGCSGSTGSDDTTGTVINIVDDAAGGSIEGTIRITGAEGYFATVELDDGTVIEAELSGMDEPLQITTGETKVAVQEQAGKWVIAGAPE